MHFILDLKNPCAQKRKGRGPTRNLRLAAMSEGEKFDITWRNHRPVGANSTIFKAECTILVRQTHDIPLQVKGWMEIPFDIKKKLFEHMLVCKIKYYEKVVYRDPLIFL